MARKNLIRSPFHAYHIVNRVNNRENFQMDIREVWDLFCTELWRMIVTRGLKIHAFVLMSNHYHLLASPGEEDLGIVMSDWTSSLTKEYNQMCGRVGHLFNGRYRWSMIDQPLYFALALKYIYRNPCKAGICRNPGEYPFSTFTGIMGHTKLPLPLSWPITDHDRFFLPDDPYHLEEWVNEPFLNEEYEIVRKANRRKVFKFSKRDENKILTSIATHRQRFRNRDLKSDF